MKRENVNAGFGRWTVFEKTRSANRMRHQEAYETMESVLTDGFKRPPRILDIGCGDVRDIREILKRIPAAEYTGIDNSSAALDHAHIHLTGMPAP